MSRFIPEGKSDMKSLQEKERLASKQFQDEQEDKEKLSLYEQMRLNYLAKEQEYEDKVKAKNQSHKISQKELDHYNELERKKKAEELRKKREIEDGLRDFEEERKKKIKSSSNKKPDIEALPITSRKLTKPSLGIAKRKNVTNDEDQNTEQTPKHSKETKKVKGTSRPLVSGYDSDSD